MDRAGPSLAITHNALRIVAGLLFWQHGAQKLFGMLGARRSVIEGTAELVSWYGLAGVLEFFGGILILIGLFTRPVAFVLAGEMAVAYFWRHLPRDFWPIQNGGELAALFCFLFLFLAAAGPGRFSLDGLLRSRVEPAEALPDARPGAPRPERPRDAGPVAGEGTEPA